MSETVILICDRCGFRSDSPREPKVGRLLRIGEFGGGHTVDGTYDTTDDGSFFDKVGVFFSVDQKEAQVFDLCRICSNGLVKYLARTAS